MAVAGADSKQLWRRQWLESLTEISALEFQRRTWGQTPNPHDSYVEYTEVYFSDLLAGGDYEKLVREGLLSFAEALAVAEFHLKFRAYRPADPYAFDAILADPRWIEITQSARQTRQALLKLVTDPDERSILLQAEPQPA